MDAKTLVRPFRPLHRVFSEPLASVKPDVERATGTAAQAVWLGLVSAWVELVVLLVHRALDGTISLSNYRLNWYYVPLGMAAHLMIAAVWFGPALGLHSLAQRWNVRAPRLAAAWLGWFLTLVSPVLAIDALHGVAGLVLAAGLSARVAPWWVKRHPGVLRRSLRPLAAVSVLVGVTSFAWVHSREPRALSALPAARADSPNVVLLVLDTVRADHLGLYGYHRATSPNLDALAARSIVFDTARAPAPWTLASHATMFTGHWPHELSVDTDSPLDATFPTLAEHLADRGYATGGFAANSIYCNAWFGLDRGFAHYDDIPENRTLSVQEALRSAELGRRLMTPGVRLGLWPSNGHIAPRRHADEVHASALTWLDAQGLGAARGGRPFFLFLNDIDAHDPYTVPKGFPTLYSRARPSDVFNANTRAFKALSPVLGTGASETEKRAAADGLMALGVDAYDDCIRYLDEQVGKLLDGLESRGLADSTWVVVTADHGEHFGERGQFWHGSSLYRPVIDVPLLIVPPKGSPLAGAPRRVPAPVSLRDLPATLADLADPSAKSPFPGRSLARFWDGRASESDADAPLSEFRIFLPGDTPAKGLTDGERFRTAVATGGKIYHRGPIGPEELYDQADRGEITNLAPTSPSVVERVRKVADQLIGK